MYIPPIKTTIDLEGIKFTEVYKLLTDLPTLQQWWAPEIDTENGRVVFSNTREAEMNVKSTLPNRSVTWTWRWLKPYEDTGTSSIKWLIVPKAGGLLSVIIDHNEWTSRDERNRQEKYWPAIESSFKAIAKGESPSPWWKD